MPSAKITKMNKLQNDINNLKKLITEIKPIIINETKKSNNHKIASYTKYTDTEAISAIDTDNKYLKKDGTEILVANWNIGDARKIKTDEISARDNAGLKLYDNSGRGIFVKDGGDIGINETAPLDKLYVKTTGGLNKYGVYIRNTGGSAGFTCNGAAGKTWAFFTGGSAFVIKNLTDDLYNLCVPNDYNGFWVGKGGFVNPENDVLFMNTGNFGIQTLSPTCKLDVNGNKIRIRTSKTPTSATAAGNQGDICWDTNYIYVCTATNTWKRVAISSW